MQLNMEAQRNNNEDEIIVKMSLQEAKHIISALLRTHASGKDLNVSGELENKLADIVYPSVKS